MEVEGRIFRMNPYETIVEVTGDTSLSVLPGVECLNPDDEENCRVYRRVFKKKRIYLPGEYKRAVSEQLLGLDNILVFGMSGYSLLTPEQCRAWGVKVGAYESACGAILRGVVHHLREQFIGVDVRIAHGASNMGIDKAAINVGRHLIRPQLGHSCPEFMFYVADDDIPVYVARTQAEYSRAFIQSLDILIVANGRVQAFEHDIDAAFRFHKHIIPINVLKSISATGGPPAFNANGEIEDAVAAMEHLVHMTNLSKSRGRDTFDELCRHVNETTVAIARQILSPECAFGRL